MQRHDGDMLGSAAGGQDLVLVQYDLRVVLVRIFLANGRELIIQNLRQHVHFLDARCATIDQQRKSLEQILLQTYTFQRIRV